MPSKYKIYFFLLLSHSVFSQNFLGITGSNYAGTLSIPTNPANVVDTRQSVFINLAAGGFDLQNNYVRWNAPFSLTRFLTQSVPSKYENPASGKIIWKTSYLKTSASGKNVSTFANGEARGPAIGIDIKKWKIGIAVGVRYRYLSSLSKTSDEVGQMLIETTKSPDLMGNIYTGEKGYLNSTFFNEFYGTIGKVFIEDGETFLKIGASAKYYISNNFNSIIGKSFGFQVQQNANDLNRQDLTLSNVTGSLTKASNYTSLGISNFTSQMLQFNGLGKGFGGDIGVIYEYRPNYQEYYRTHKGIRKADPTKNKYLYKIGFSLIDIGYIKFYPNANVQLYDLTNDNTLIAPQTYGKFKGFEAVTNTTTSIFNKTALANGQFFMFMPASSVFTIDYNLNNKIYVNVNWRQSLLSLKRRGIIGYSGISVIPRYEKRSLEVALPMSVDNNYKNLNVGFSFRYYGFFFGSDNVTGWLNLLNPRGVSLYSGIFIPIYNKLPESPLKCFSVPNRGSYKKKKLRIL